MMEKYPRSMATFACNMDAWPRQVQGRGEGEVIQVFVGKVFLKYTNRKQKNPEVNEYDDTRHESKNAISCHVM